MKKILLALPVVLLFANCRTTERTGTTSISTDTNGSVSATSTTPGSYTASSRYKGYDINKYDPNNYMQNPDKYKTPNELAKTGGWTYNTEWNQNTNFLAEALGEWLLEPTPEVAAFWIADSSRADTYASYWTPEAVAARQHQKMLAQAAYNDSVALAQGFSEATASSKKGKASGIRRNMNQSTSSTDATGTDAMNATNATNTSMTANAQNDSTLANSGTDSTSTASNTKNYLMAVNGNMYQVPRLNLFLQNGTFVGYTGSNQLVGTLKVDGSQLRFDPTIPSTNMSATGGFSQSAFMERLARVDSYDVTNGQLRLKQGSEILFVLAKSAMQ